LLTEAGDKSDIYGCVPPVAWNTTVPFPPVHEIGSALEVTTNGFGCVIPNEYSVSWEIYGSKNDTPYFEHCLAESKKGNHNISFKGEVSPDKIPTILKQAHFFILATWGENFGHAIAESLINGVPVIISDRTPWRDLEESRAGWDLPLEQDAFVNKLVYAANMDNESYQILRKGALNMGFKKTNTPEAIRQNKALFE
jgi:glycosyltransferase involved in cell wall biosynthesis